MGWQLIKLLVPMSNVDPLLNPFPAKRKNGFFGKKLKYLGRMSVTWITFFTK